MNCVLQDTFYLMGVLRQIKSKLMSGRQVREGAITYLADGMTSLPGVSRLDDFRLVWNWGVGAVRV